MRRTLTRTNAVSLLCAGVLGLLAACSDDATGTAAGATGSRGGSITLESTTYTLGTFRQCTIFEGVVNVWGMTSAQPPVEITLDVGGPDQLRIGADGAADAWVADAATLKVSVSGRQVSGTARLSRVVDGVRQTEEASFSIQCG